MISCKQIHILLMLAFVINGTVAPMEQPLPIQQADQTAPAQKGWGWQTIKEGFNYISSPISSFGSWVKSSFSNNLDATAIHMYEDQEAQDQQLPHQPELQQLNENHVRNVRPENNISTVSHTQKNNPSGNPTTLTYSQKQSPQVPPQQLQPQNNLIKKPTRLYYVIGGSLFVTGAAIVYKAINYLRLSGVKRNLCLLDDLIVAANTLDQHKLADFYEAKKVDLTLLLDSEKGLLQHLLPEKSKFVEAATKIKQVLPERIQENMFTRIGNGIKDDVKRAQGWSARARNAIKEKLAKVFKGIK